MPATINQSQSESNKTSSVQSKVVDDGNAGFRRLMNDPLGHLQAFHPLPGNNSSPCSLFRGSFAPKDTQESRRLTHKTWRYTCRSVSRPVCGLYLGLIHSEQCSCVKKVLEHLTTTGPVHSVTGQVLNEVWWGKLCCKVQPLRKESIPDDRLQYRCSGDRSLSP